ncbi:UDP-N-acetylglucosamine:LPS N-acetylglucosamine transferase [endosymbiont of Sipalinus gigas]|uniref:UDP-N-acetylglucosamine--N-acetylmuramyl- (pentapeptide) pyrophosphoryl-undecaprenol N-acetylglucosamine transferase n=1 Tax=endosymbiont of Sipalinus gigas TaxID=1972134 RepID=UPI000DC723CA|nr:UDP-N-acetylglucosamine--N-acetylmuramyl-(pentapeptide) pyrophosphoryl-undecaprenol N-acetylglucosamine transferase [endosymbiont of Sipalinus gigas]BBA85178.1 UDP-N-acetylglucosamine:LPS N-acetylglucosamine transferase [endosymbiont of Sipalinus gigas]
MKKKIIITTNGSGGHIFSGLIIANELLKQNFDVFWIYNDDGIVFLNMNINIKIKKEKISIKNFRKLSIINKIFFPINLLISIFESILIILKIKPDIILGMGNYISLPVCISGYIFNIPIIIHEQNSILGTTNYILKGFANKLLKGIDYNDKKYIITGNPINNDILNIKCSYNKYLIKKKKINILVIGGSKGSNFINENIPLLINKLSNSVNIWHQVGIGNKFKIIEKYKYLNICKYLYSIDEFIYNIYYSYKWADIIISRSGALIVSEIIYAKLPAIFIPLNSKDNHQYFNALKLEEIGVAKIFNQNDFNINLIYKYILNLIENNKLLSMHRKFKYINIGNPNNNIINEIKSLI